MPDGETGDGYAGSLAGEMNCLLAWQERLMILDDLKRHGDAGEDER